MIFLTEDVCARLRANDSERRTLDDAGGRFDPAPVVKLFNPMGAATWLATELADDGDTLFGLADLGFGCPELGYFSLAEIASVRLPFGLRIERDLGFETPHRLSQWAEWARRAGSILHAEALLRRAPRANRDPDIPPPQTDGG